MSQVARSRWYHVPVPGPLHKPDEQTKVTMTGARIHARAAPPPEFRPGMPDRHGD